MEQSFFNYNCLSAGVGCRRNLPRERKSCLGTAFFSVQQDRIHYVARQHEKGVNSHDSLIYIFFGNIKVYSIRLLNTFTSMYVFSGLEGMCRCIPYSISVISIFFFNVRCFCIVVYFFRLRNELETYETKIAESTKRLR